MQFFNPRNIRILRLLPLPLSSLLLGVTTYLYWGNFESSPVNRESDYKITDDQQISIPKKFDDRYPKVSQQEKEKLITLLRVKNPAIISMIRKKDIRYYIDKKIYHLTLEYFKEQNKSTPIILAQGFGKIIIRSIDGEIDPVPSGNSKHLDVYIP